MGAEPESICKECESLKKRISDLEAQLEKVTAALEKSRRSGKRQAAPFRKDGKKAPKKPGRKSGDEHGPHAHRGTPAPEDVDEVYEVPLPSTCACCSSPDVFELEFSRQQYQTDIIVTTVVRQFNIAEGVCNACGSTVVGRHDLQTSDATGAAGHQFGPWVHAAFVMLNKCYGLSYGKIQKLFEELLGLKISRASGARSILRSAKRCEPAAVEIKNDLQASSEVTPDETGWRVGGANAWLHAFATPKTVWYEIDVRRDASIIKRLLGADWSGWLVHDGWSPYDSLLNAIHQQCTAHLLRRCNELLETAMGGAARFPLAVKGLLKRGLEIRDRFKEGELTERGMKNLAGQLDTQLTKLVLPPRRHEANNRFAWFLYNHLDQIFEYLRRPGMAATNFRGELAIRPAVVNRKVWGGNRTWKGAYAQGILTSVIQTCRLRLVDPFQHMWTTLTSPQPIVIPQPAE